MKKYPFFDTTIREITIYRSTRIVYEYDHKQFGNLQDAKEYVIRKLQKMEYVNKFSEIHHPAVFYINTTGWPNNVGNGKYIKPYANNIRYIWIEGMHQPWRSSCNSYSIRFDFNTPQNILEEWCVKIYNRHLKRHLKILIETENKQ